MNLNLEKKVTISKSIQHILLLVTLLISPFYANEQQKEIQSAKNSITSKSLKSHIDFLASSFCRGRKPGDKGMDLAEKYITTILSGSDISPAGRNQNYFQKVKLQSIDIDDRTVLIVKNGNTEIKADLNWDFLPLTLSAERNVLSDISFVGYGITAPEHKYDDYKNINVRDKIVLVLRHEPGAKDENSPFDGVKSSRHAPYLQKILNAQKHGARGIIFFEGPLSSLNSQIRGNYVPGAYWPTQRKEDYRENEDFKFFDFSPDVSLIGNNYGITIPALVVSGQFAQTLLGEQIDIEAIQKKLDKKLKPQSFHLMQRVRMEVNFKHRPLKANNIVFKVKGIDKNLRNEIIIICAHHDHLGKNKRGLVYGGADDNASGTAAVIEIAKAFRTCKLKPKRTILFLLLTAEEMGLLGSRYYVDHPLFSLDKTLAVFNLDMVGRNNIDQMGILGKYQYPKLFAIIDKINKQTFNFEFNLTTEDYLRNSDHFPFMRAGIPSMFFNSGMHDQLHRPEDKVRRIIPEKVEKAAKLTFLSVWDIANRPSGFSLK